MIVWYICGPVVVESQELRYIPGPEPTASSSHLDTVNSIKHYRSVKPRRFSQTEWPNINVYIVSFNFVPFKY